MTTSYKIEAVKELRAQKKLDREAEAEALSAQNAEVAKEHAENLARIAKKEASIASGAGPVSEPELEAEPEVKPEPVAEKPAAKKAAPKKKGRPAKKS